MSKNYLNLSQRDPRWKNLKMGKSNRTIGGFGCLITSVANLMCKTPIEIVNSARFDDTGDAYWDSFQTDVWKFRRLSQVYERETIRNLANDDNVGIILKISTDLAPTTGHWILLQSLGNGGYNCIDPYPYDGQDQTQARLRFYPISKVLKHAEFVKKV